MVDRGNEIQLERFDAVFLLGPQKSGKTSLLKQMNENISNSQYLNFKTLSDDDSMRIINIIADDILAGAEKTYLIDEATYIFFQEAELNKLSEMYYEAEEQGIEIKTKIVVSGCPAKAIEVLGRRAFGGEAGYIKMLKPEEELRFICDTIDICDSVSVEAYIKENLHEMEQCDIMFANCIVGMELWCLTVDNLRESFYAYLYEFCIQNPDYKELCCNIEEIASIGRANMQNLDAETKKQIKNFWKNCGFTIFTEDFNL